MADENVNLIFTYTVKPADTVPEDLEKQLAEASGKRKTATKNTKDVDPYVEGGMLDINKIIGALNQDTSLLSGEDKKKADLTKFLSDQFDKISGIFTKGVTMAFDVVDDIYKEMKKASPLLQTLESLFNLAMQLFFMPLGNKLAEVLLPAVINLVEMAAKMWDELGDGNLSQMFAKAIEYGIRIIGDFFKETGNLLKDQGGLLGSLGKIMISVGNFIQGPMLNVVQFILDAVGFVIENLKSIISAIVAFKVASLAMDLITMHVIIAANSEAGGTSIGTGAALALAGTAGAIAYGTSYGILSSQGMADGGLIKHTPGGRLITVAENEDEIIMPRSKAGVGGNITNNFYGYTSQDIEDMITHSVSEKISISRIKGGF